MMSSKTILENYEEILVRKKLTNGQKKALLAAINLFAKQGYDATSTAQIAKYANISEATIYKYYSTKEKLLFEIINLIATELFPKFQREFVSKINEISDKSVKEIITFIVFNRFEFMKKNHQILRIFIQESLTKSEVREIIHKGFIEAMDSNQEMLKKLKKMVASKHPGYDTVVFVRTIVGPIIAYFVQRFILAPDVPYDEKRDLNLIVTQIVSGLK